eukprot:49186-Rhodomonas_salina.1
MAAARRLRQVETAPYKQELSTAARYYYHALLELLCSQYRHTRYCSQWTVPAERHEYLYSST